MKIKVFQTNPNGKIEFTPAELEKLLNDTFAEGQKECNCNKSITWINPYLNQPMCYQDEETITTARPAMTKALVSAPIPSVKHIPQQLILILKTQKKCPSILMKSSRMQPLELITMHFLSLQRS